MLDNVDLEKINTLIDAVREKHRPLCAACGGYWKDQHYEGWGAKGYIYCTCLAGNQCKILKALVGLGEV